MIISNFENFKNYVLKLINSKLTKDYDKTIYKQFHIFTVRYDLSCNMFSITFEFSNHFRDINKKVQFCICFCDNNQFIFKLTDNPKYCLYGTRLNLTDFNFTQTLNRINRRLINSISEFDEDLLTQLLEFDLNSLLNEFEKELLTC